MLSKYLDEIERGRKKYSQGMILKYLGNTRLISKIGTHTHESIRYAVANKVCQEYLPDDILKDKIQEAVRVGLADYIKVKDLALEIDSDDDIPPYVAKLDYVPKISSEKLFISRFLAKRGFKYVDLKLYKGFISRLEYYKGRIAYKEDNGRDIIIPLVEGRTRWGTGTVRRLLIGNIPGYKSYRTLCIPTPSGRTKTFKCLMSDRRPETVEYNGDTYTLIS